MPYLPCATPHSSATATKGRAIAWELYELRPKCTSDEIAFCLQNLWRANVGACPEPASLFVDVKMLALIPCIIRTTNAPVPLMQPSRNLPPKFRCWKPAVPSRTMTCEFPFGMMWLARLGRLGCRRRLHLVGHSLLGSKTYVVFLRSFLPLARGTDYQRKVNDKFVLAKDRG